jgi:hypothetical protein
MKPGLQAGTRDGQKDRQRAKEGQLTVDIESEGQT